MNSIGKTVAPLGCGCETENGTTSTAREVRELEEGTREDGGGAHYVGPARFQASPPRCSAMQATAPGCEPWPGGGRRRVPDILREPSADAGT